MPKQRKQDKRRAVGVVRVSRVAEREGDSFVSPGEQRDRIRAACERDGLDLLDVLSELDVSGGAPLAKRPGLRRAVEMVEAAEAEVVIVAYLDRLVRSLTVQAEVVSRVEAAGGSIFAVDVGQLTNGSAGQWLSGTLLGAVAEYSRRMTAERTAEAKRRAVERGVPPFPNIPPGYRRGEGGRLETAPEAAAVAEAFRLRADGATIRDVRAYLRAHGVERSYKAVAALLASRIVLGELRFGSTVNERSHPAIVDAVTWARVQRMSVPVGRRGQSDRLLARLGVLRCASCGSRMVVSSTGGRYWFYRCAAQGDCERRVTIGAELAEAAIAEEAQRLLAGLEGRASIEDGAQDAARELERLQGDLDAALRAFAGLEDEAAARERLAELRAARDEARERLEELAAAAGIDEVVSATGSWDDLTLDERRALVRATISSATVARGRGPDRIVIAARSK